MAANAKQASTFVHEALFYADDDEFLATAVPFIREGLDEGAAILVAVDEQKIQALCAQLRGDFDLQAIEFVNMRGAGRNPARIIPIWRDFADNNPGPLRGIGEPVWAGRSEAELIECHHHEMLLNRAFAQTSEFNLLCPYDATALDDEVLERVFASHCTVLHDGQAETSEQHSHGAAGGSPFTGELAPPPAKAFALEFSARDLRVVRDIVGICAERIGLSAARCGDLVLAAHEIATNSVSYGGGKAQLRIWSEPDRLITEFSDDGRFHNPLVGRERPDPAAESGRGVWLANCLTDLVQIRSSDAGNTVRVHMQRP